MTIDPPAFEADFLREDTKWTKWIDSLPKTQNF